MHLIDTHTHLYSKEFSEDLDEVVKHSTEKGVQQFLLPNVDRNSIEPMLELERKYPGVCFPMMGLHPCSVGKNYKEDLEIVKTWLNKRSFCAIGEIGMDLYWDKTYREEQEEAFIMQSAWAVELGVPIVIHSRETTDLLIDIIKNINNPKLTGIFHCFGGTLEQAEQIIELGFSLGIGGVLTFKKSGLDQVLSSIDLDHLVLETDAPYLAPVPYRGKRNESTYIRIIAEALAKTKQVSVEEVAQRTTANARKIFKHPFDSN